MRIRSTRVHGFMDYGMGFLLILSPYLLGFADGDGKQWVPMALGAGAIGYSLLTRYELGAIKIIPMPAHLGLDIASGLLLAASPWLLGFANEVYLPHLILGLIEIGTAAMTQTTATIDRGYALQRPMKLRFSPPRGSRRNCGMRSIVVIPETRLRRLPLPQPR